MDKLSFAEFIAYTEYGGKLTADRIEWAERIIRDMVYTRYHSGDCTNENYSCSLCLLETELKDYYNYCLKNHFLKL